GAAGFEAMLGAGKVEPSFPQRRMLDHEEGRGAPLQPIPGIDLVAALLIARGHAHAMKRRGAARQGERADVVAVVEKLGEHKITRVRTSFLYTVRCRRASNERNSHAARGVRRICRSRSPLSVPVRSVSPRR